MSDGDSRAALLKALAFISGCHKEKLTERSLLSGQENFVTFQIELQRTFSGIGLVWNILRRYLPETITNGVKGMRSLASQQGAVFDVEEQYVKEFQELFEDTKGKKDFEIFKCQKLPEFYEASSNRPQQNGYGNFNTGYGGNRGGFA